MWRFAEEIRLPVAWHHEPGQAPDQQKSAGIAYLANRLAHRYGFGCEPEEIDLLTDPVFTGFGFDEGFLERLDPQAPRLLDVASARYPGLQLAVRETITETLVKELHAGELDAIVLKALRRDPTRRYTSVEALGDDSWRVRKAAVRRGAAPVSIGRAGRPAAGGA